jgi:hypothetical protein
LAQLSKRGIALAVLTGLLIAAYFGIRAFGPSFTAKGQPSLEDLSAATLPTLTARFDAASDSTRLLILLSPT